jgi:hypothetical protein
MVFLISYRQAERSRPAFSSSAIVEFGPLALSIDQGLVLSPSLLDTPLCTCR